MNWRDVVVNVDILLTGFVAALIFIRVAERFSGT